MIMAYAVLQELAPIPNFLIRDALKKELGIEVDGNHLNLDQSAWTQDTLDANVWVNDSAHVSISISSDVEVATKQMEAGIQ